MRLICGILGQSCLRVVGLGVFLMIGRMAQGAEPEALWTQLRQGQYDAVLQAVDKELEEPFGEQEEWHLLKIEALLAQGRYPEAMEAATAGVETVRRSLRLRWAARDAFLANGETQRAYEFPEQIEALMTSRSRGYRRAADIVVFGQAMLLRGTDPKVILDRVFTTAQQADPDAREPYLARGRLALEKNDGALAAKAFQEGLEKFPEDAEFHYGLAEAFASSDREAMGASLDAALKHNPHHVPAMLRVADSRIDAEDYAAAAEWLGKAEAVNPHHPDLWAYRAVIAHLKPDAAAEADARARALAFWKNNPRVDHLIGRKLSQKYRFAEGAAYQRRALEHDANYQPAQSQLASDLLRLGEEDEGWRLAAEVHALDGYDVPAFNLMTLRDTMEKKFATLKNGDFTVRMALNEAPIYGQRALELLGEARRVLGAKYGIDVTRPTIVEIFQEQKDFGVRTFGMPENPGYLGVCFGRVVTMNSPASSIGHAVNWEAVLWHEFCHTVTLQATRNRMPRWLSEGISVYEERQANPAWGEHMIPRYREMILEGKLTPVGKLSGAFMVPETPLHLQFAYYESSLVIEFIVERHGLEAVKAILKDLHDGISINDSLARRVAPLGALETDFAAYAKTLANAMSPGLDWTKPSPEMLLPGGEGQWEAWSAAHPDNYYALQRQAGRAMDDQKWAEAKAPLQRLIALFPRQTGGESPYAALAKVHHELGETPDERATLARLAELDPAAPDVYQRLIDLAIAANDWEDVARQARRYLAVNPLVPAPHRALAQAADKTGAASVGIMAWRTLLALDPPNPAEAHFQLARWLHRAGDPGARRHALMALEETPRHRPALRLLLDITGQAAATPAPAPAN